MTAYDHTQKGVLHWLVAATGLVCGIAAAGATSAAEHGWLLLLPTAVLLSLAPCFAHLRVRGTDTALKIAFGPISVFRKSVRYDEIEAADIARSTLVDGWGIHRTPGRGWIWNVHGFRCVELQLSDARRLRIGTDDPEGLKTFLRSRIAGR
jgi:hypothetical protein